MLSVIKTYYRLTKPGIVYGNILTTAAGFFLASKNHINLVIFLGVMVGTACIIASACVFNNYLDRKLDAKMDRTKKRALVTGQVSVQNAIIFATILGLLGFFLLATYTNLVTVVVGLIGFVDYVIFYGISKRRSIHGTLVGAISGAMPIVAGYTAVTNSFDTGAILLFLILAFWQMPHFYAIAIYRLNDYKNASIPVLPVKKGIFQTKIHMLIYLIGFIITSVLLTVYKLTGIIYLIAITLLGFYWLWYGVKGFTTKDSTHWARKMFLFSLIAITVFSCLLLGTVALP